jgi:methionyl aminopeptidase
VIITHDEQLTGLMQAGQCVARILQAMQRHAVPGMTTLELDQFGASLFAMAGARSAPQLCYDFPGHTCISINGQAAHGVPGQQMLQVGDLINIDVSAELGGYFADTGGSFVLPGAAPDITALKQRLSLAARHARDTGVAFARSGRRLNELGRRIHNSIQAAGFCNVRNLCGHGVGAHLHEEPTVRNYFDSRDSMRLLKGQVITIEPFLSTNVSRVHELDDGWTLAGRNSSLFAQHEHTIVVTDGEPIVLTLP